MVVPNAGPVGDDEIEAATAAAGAARACPGRIGAPGGGAIKPLPEGEHAPLYPNARAALGRRQGSGR